jgi:hypothetical protein
VSPVSIIGNGSLQSTLASRQLVLKADKRRLVLFTVVSAGILVVSAANSERSSTFWYSATLYILIFIIFLSWLASYKVVIKGDVFSYFVVDRSPIIIHRGEILHVAPPRGRFQNVIKVERHRGGEVLINAKPFSRSDLKIIMEFLGGPSP